MTCNQSRSVKALQAIVVGSIAVILVACTTMPTIVNFNHDQQKQLSSAAHWRIIAGEVLADVSDDVAEEAATDQPACIHIDPPDPKTMSSFQAFLTSAVTEELLKTGSTRQRAQSRIERLEEQAKVDKTRTKEQIEADARAKADADEKVAQELKAARDHRPARLYIQATSPQRTHNCNVITLTTAVIEHKGPVARSYPFKYTALAAGLVGIRHVAHAFSEARFVGTVGAAEAAFWLASGFEVGDTMTELTITTSYTNSQGFYLAETTSVYYIDTKDSDLYKAPPSDDVTKDHVREAQLDGNPRSPRLAFDGSAWKEGDEREAEGTHWRPWHAFPPQRRLVVHPETISVCDPQVEFAVTGIFLSYEPKAYLLGTLPAANFGEVQPEPFDGPQTAQLKFEKLNTANIGLTDLTFSMVSRDGITGTAHVSVEGDPKSCVPAKQTSTPPPPSVTATAGNVEITPAVIGGSTAEVCLGPWGLVLTGAGAPDVKSAEITQGKHVGRRRATKDGKTVAFTFDPLTEYRGKSLPAGDKVAIQFKNSKGNAFEQSVSAKCTSPDAAGTTTKQTTGTAPPKKETTQPTPVPVTPAKPGNK